MSLTPSTMLPLGTAAPEFSLMNVDGQMVSLADYAEAPALVVAFLSNHCPYVKHLADDFAMFANDVMAKGAAVVAIASNDVSNYPADSPEQMVAEAEARGYHFPYLYDETQEVAKAYAAACTPDFYVFDAKHQLAYRGQFDSSRPESGNPITGADLRAAVEAVLAGQALANDQKPSVGCNIKWKAGNEPAYFG